MKEKDSILPRGQDCLPAPGPVQVLGIDLGTTNCSVSRITTCCSNHKSIPDPECLEIRQPNPEGGEYVSVLMPSVLALYQGRVYTGEGARRLRAGCAESGSGLRHEQSIFWEDKNFMGVKKTMHKAPSGYQSSKEIAGHLLRFILQSCRREKDLPASRTVVTVPACFEQAQRRDTLEACAMAGLDISPGDLLDEPVAAFVHYLFSRDRHGINSIGHDLRCMIFDFGGGTCDVAVFSISLRSKEESIRVSPLAVSRYHKLGGADIDRAVVYEALIPQLIEQENLAEFDLDFDAKKNALEPALIGIAEMLKTGLCREMDRIEQLSGLEGRALSRITKKYPGRIECPLPDGRRMYLDEPCLDAELFSGIMAPFLDTDIPYHKETEYRWTCSIFVPMQDALLRAGLDEKDIDLCLLVGGSSRIPQVRRAIQDFFSKAVVESLAESEMQTATAKGACLHAWMLESMGQSIVRPACAGSIYIQTRCGPQMLISANTPLPFPGRNQWEQCSMLSIPETALSDPVILRIELMDGQGKILKNWVWELEPPVNRGEQILLQYHMDENQTLQMQLSLPGKPEQKIRCLDLENPVSSVVNPNAKRREILELEEAVRTRQVPEQNLKQTTERIAGLYQEIGQKEKALSLYRNMLALGGPDFVLLNRLGMLYGETGDYGREEKFYLEADRHARNWKGALFNLALSYRRQGRYREAADILDRAIQAERIAPYLVLRAMVAEALQEKKDR
ncbi:Hsp70 family protein [Desulfonatronospira sp.]|uniref:Hsp70 family protein n=1 Tax=Desulfonatronospira sp. TaxID=1962951 RepID=UPI0025B9FCE1|nr:Hsp70 family protein [Desulfonatronospira sp.]